MSADSEAWVAAEILREEFLHSEEDVSAVETTEELEDASEASAELFARFLAFTAAQIGGQNSRSAAYTAVLTSAFAAFTDAYLSKEDIHSLTAAFDTDARKTVLSAYYRALATLEEQGVSDIPRGPSSALLDAAAAGKASIYALFGGQGTNEVYFDELQALYDIYKPFVEPFLTALTINTLQPLASASTASYYAYGFDVVSWLSGALPRPPVEYLASIPMSLPLIGLTQLTQYLVSCRVANLTPGEMRSRISGATGHSQGIISAVCISVSGSHESYLENASRSLKWLFFSGLRGQEAFPVLALESNVVRDSIEGSEGIPTPMLSVTGLLLKDLTPHIISTNKHLPANSRVQVSLYNGPKAFVITGPPKSLYGLVVNLRKIRASSGLDQSKIAFSQRKPVFSVRFLVINAPYHSDYLKGATDKVVADLQSDLWKPVDLAIPVYHTETGE